ncbi:ABC transporter ATP-binding protein [Anaerotignum propionicum]|jgi:putative ABC transport system ATP-binding protein|uniref:ABC transport system ATP-binding protein n=1 Tax=Anaerotignum propionicum DSM 1682 TaxID=991789 RepID=A0A0X1U8L4_ANAPI|nr:ABC transporter ATP-binding protein [Anaerotignum propionicum]AMJ41279.1 putative ABC transporter ATP-binding protein [Anaerotignum propionicum DSM 1682]MEA4841881.1 ABC transporter ATP-binding protein [[Clostridium] symbiosum]SHF06470.1 putative ABC transport system ATP-binding protein [[Clostridium] propionicum DSM 1682] [Anaerotignum propionicum DSM 1682]
MEKEPIIQLKNITKEYKMGEVSVKALRGVDFSLYDNELVVILGTSGSGKSTMLNIIGGIDKPTRGDILYNGKNISYATEAELTKFRREAVGFVFQFYNLIPNLTARENILLASELSSSPISADELLKQIGLEERGDHFPSQLSGGEQQRIAIARAVSKNPPILLCDEPTGALDFKTGIQVLRILKDYQKTRKKIVVIITHNSSIGEMADRVIHVRDGLIDSITENKNPVLPEELRW